MVKTQKGIKMNNTRRTKKRTAFTMVELMAVLIILGLLMTVVATKVVGKIDKAKQTTTKANLVLLRDAITQFYMDTGYYPEEDPGLYALVEQPPEAEGWMPGGYLQTKDLPLDGWKREFIYLRDPEPDQAFVIISLGADGEEGGEGLDTDLYSTDAN